MKVGFVACDLDRINLFLIHENLILDQTSKGGTSLGLSAWPLHFDGIEPVPQPPQGNPKVTEERLDEIRKAAADNAPPVGQGRGPAKHPPQIRGRESYYGLPVLKAPVWTWEIPLYFFVGGIAGVSAVIAFAAQMFGSDPVLTRAALWVAIMGATICPVLLIANLGRPERFLAMLRVAKIQSPMSVGVWTLVAFSGCVFVALVGNELILRGYVSPLMIGIRLAGEMTGALTGLILAAYTGVPIGSRNVAGSSFRTEQATRQCTAASRQERVDVSHCWHAGWSWGPSVAPHVRVGLWTLSRGDMLPGRLLAESVCLDRTGVASTKDPEAPFQIQRKA